MAEQLADFLSRKFEPVPHIIGRGVLPSKGKLILGGEPKTNKSWILLNIFLDLARGRRVFDASYGNGKPVLPVNRAYRTLYLEMELGDDGLRDRLLGVDEGHPGLLSSVDCKTLPIFVKTRDTAMRLDTPDGRDFINAEIAQVKPDVVMFDPLSKFHLSDENSSQETGAIMRAADHIIEQHGCSVVFTHHTSKPFKDDVRQGGNRLRGSSAIFGDIDTFVEVTRKSSDHAIEPVLQLDFTLRRGEPIETLFVQRKRTGEIEWLGDGFEFSNGKSFPKAKYKDL